MLLAILAAMAAVTAAMPSFIAVPADQIAFVDLSAMRVRRVPRQTLTPPPLPPQLPHQLYEEEYQPIPIQQYEAQPIALAAPFTTDPRRAALVREHPVNEPSEISTVNDRPPDFGEYVDFGAHTGDHGAFGWYADFPVNNHQHSNYK